MAKHKDFEFWVPIVVIAAVSIAAVIGVVVAVQPFEGTAGTCKNSGVVHKMNVSTDAVSPASIQGIQCDTLTITNNTGAERTIMFGHADEMEPYDGVHEKQLKAGESFSVRLYEKGDFHFHEHEADLVGDFTVR
ncbi:MAG: hypothetical protein WBP12_02455 [Candidatus Saccharimonas sp.]